jgi:ABC-type transport system involved in cytochrome bd biosynthesis fused ATPase/permease subunit
VVQAPALNAEAAAQEAAAALAVAVALVQSLPKFISPYLPALLEHTLNPVVRLIAIWSLSHRD